LRSELHLSSLQNCGRRFPGKSEHNVSVCVPSGVTLRCGHTEIADNMSARRRTGLRPTLRCPKIATDEARRKPECSNDEYFRTNALLHSDLVIPSSSNASGSDYSSFIPSLTFVF
jgi:hypothetical protein